VSDNEHTAASLGHSEILSVQNSIGEPIPEFDQSPEYGTKVPSASRRQDAGDVLPHQPSGACSVSKAKKLKGQVATVVCQSRSEPGDAERLAGGSSDKKVNWFIRPLLEFGHVAEVRHVGVVVREHRRRERFDFAERHRLPAERVPCNGRGFDAAAD
jgi:hypothetical protein